MSSPASWTKGSAVRALTRQPETAALPAQVEVVEGDVGRPETIEAAVRGTQSAFLLWLGAMEEVSEEQLRALVETNLLGPVWLTRAVLPIMRAQGGGHILQVSSQTVHFQVPTLGAYQISKWGLEGFSESLAAEVAGQGIRVTIIEPEGYTTDWGGSSLVVAEPLPAYTGVHAAVQEMMAGIELGDPHATSAAIFAVVEAEEPPLRIFLGRTPQALAKQTHADRIAEWDAWEPVSVAASGR
jgi:NAD(P)-dependent dehydrogenase (short-subunit alcohol dehydrogenase family)